MQLLSFVLLFWEREQCIRNSLSNYNSKGFDVYTADGLNKALHWLQTADADNLMYGEPSGDEFDIMVGEMRRPMLINSVEAAIAELSLS